jgi:DNA-directed RNA polymerase specialized sigma24 family protein
LSQPGQAAAGAVPPPGDFEFDSFFRGSYKNLVRAVWLAGATREEAEDAVSDAMVYMLRRQHDGKPVSGDLAAYARTAAINYFIRAKGRGADGIRRVVASDRVPGACGLT